MDLLLIFFQIGCLVLGLYFLVYSAYFAWSIATGFLYNAPRAQPDRDLPEGIVVLLPAFRPGPVLLEVIESVQAAYSPVPVQVYVLLQKASTEIIAQIEQLDDVWIEERTFDHLEGNAYHHALRHAVADTWQRAEEEEFPLSHFLLLDLDNVVENDFIEKMTLKAAEGFAVVQGRRVPLEVRTDSQVYDAVSEELNDWMFRASKAFLGLPIELSGSALLFEADVFAHAVQHLDPRAPGMDKNLLVQMLLRNPRLPMSYCPDAVVYEEKTAAQEGLERQRLRWFGNQYFNAWYYGKKLIAKSLQAGTFGPADYAVALYRPPRSVQVVALPVFALFETFVYIQWDTYLAFFPVFFLSFGFTALGLVLFLAGSHTGRKASRLLFKLPLMALRNIHLAIKGSRKESQGKFVHTREDVRHKT